MEAIKIEGFSKSYGSFRAVKNLNLTVRKGEVMGFVGKNGAGKSTTIRSMMNLIHPSEGKITILGMDSLKEAKAIREKISYVPSETIFYERLSCEDLLRFCCSVSGASSKRIKEAGKFRRQESSFYRDRICQQQRTDLNPEVQRPSFRTTRN